MKFQFNSLSYLHLIRTYIPTYLCNYNEWWWVDSFVHRSSFFEFDFWVVNEKRTWRLFFYRRYVNLFWCTQWFHWRTYELWNYQSIVDVQNKIDKKTCHVMANNNKFMKCSCTESANVKVFRIKGKFLDD